MKKIILILLMSISFILTACGGQNSPKEISSKFWNAVQAQDMEAAKQVSTWDTVDYLRYLKKDNFHPERFELGEQKITETSAEIQTVLFTTKVGKTGVKVPGVTVLVKTEKGWKVDVRKTLGSVIKQSVNNIFDQLNNFMQQGIKEFDKTFSESMKELEKALEEGAEELKKELNKPAQPAGEKPRKSKQI